MTFTERSGNVEPVESEVELLRAGSPDTDREDEPDHNMLQNSTSGPVRPRSNLHQVIGETLELFSRHLKAEN
jgi:hypothetical protein